MSDTKITDLMRPAVLVHEKDTLRSVLEKMVRDKRNSLTVVDDKGVLVGAVNAVDIIKEVLPDYLEDDAIASRFADDSFLKEDAERVKDTPVSAFMAQSIPTISSEGSLLEASIMAIKKGRGRITVVDKEGKPLGVLTRTEIKRVIASYLNIPLEN